MEKLKQLLMDEKGQGATEYMVLLASVVAALLGAAFLFRDFFERGVNALGGNVEANLGAGFSSDGE